MRDLVFIEALEIDAIIGIFSWERKIKQTIRLSLEMECDISLAAKSRLVDNALDYKAVSKRLIAFVRESEFELLETLAEEVAEIVIREFAVPWLKLSISKPGALRGARDVGLIIVREKHHYA